MDATHLTLLVLAYSAVVFSLGLAAQGQRLLRLSMIAGGLVGICGASAMGALQFEGANFFVQTGLALARFDRLSVAALVLGTGFATPWLLALSKSTGIRAVVGVGLLCTALVGVLLSGRDLVSGYLPHPEIGRAHV